MDFSKFTSGIELEKYLAAQQVGGTLGLSAGMLASQAAQAPVKPDGITDLIEQAHLQFDALNSEVDVLRFALEPVRQILPKPIGNPATSDPDEPQAVIGLRGLIERIRMATVAMRELSSELRI
ncbi:hypothetical protein [Burkholderia thailandensis]|uniref:hypothetical protein n=1 Tax=Burkholderia thailandensis TaxID=57975 RepID=UPI0005B6C790|nr:hypothetical protein [Burkholderia thailandensis]AVR10287.1 hypothetical protein A8H31_23735 [Burkholderia thailandensis]KIS56610.1 hypothetical protein BTP_2385 [Burkholderia thailandensis Phuket 4W-1]